MFKICVEAHFHASHELALPDGSKEPSHHHKWAVTANVSSENVDNIGIVMNFQTLRGILEEITSQFHNKSLNTIDYFGQNNPSAENVAKYIFEKLEPQLPENVKLEEISVVEEPGCIAKFHK